MPRFRRPRFPLHALRRAAAALLTVAALVLALRSPPSSTARAAPPTRPVVVAAEDLPPGTVLARQQLAVARMPVRLVPAGVVVEPASLVGRVLAAGVRAREPLTDVRLVGAGLTGLLSEGQVAAPVRLADLAVARLVSPGDRVDVLATAENADRAETVAERALVLAAPARARSPDDDAGVLLLAVDPVTATRLAAAAAGSTVTVSLAPS